jgi:hypothetical protein
VIQHFLAEPFPVDLDNEELQRSSERNLQNCELQLLNVSHSVLLSGIETMNVATAVAAVDVESGESIHRWKYCTGATMHGTSLRSGGVACVVGSIFSRVLKVC